MEEKILRCECGQTISKDGTNKLNYCPKCGKPLTMQANVDLEKKENKAKLIMLYELCDEIDEGNDPRIKIDEYITELKENI